MKNNIDYSLQKRDMRKGALKKAVVPKEIERFEPTGKTNMNSANTISELFNLGFNPMYPDLFKQHIDRKSIHVNMPVFFLKGYQHRMKTSSLKELFKKESTIGNYSFMQGFRYGCFEANQYHNVSNLPQKMGIKNI